MTQSAMHISRSEGADPATREHGEAAVEMPSSANSSAKPSAAGRDRPEQTLSSWRWWHWAGTLGLVALSAAVMFDSWADTVRVGWRDEESSHILLVPLAFAWLFFVRRGRLRQCAVTAGGRWLGVGLVVIGWLMWRWGYYEQHHMPWHFGPVVVAVGVFVAMAGKDVLIKFLPAFFSLVFLVHIAAARRQQIAHPLQEATAAVTQEVSSTLGMDVVRHGNVLNVDGVDIAVAEACNGMRMVITLILASYVFAFVNPLRPWVRGLILLLAPVTAMVANIARLVPTVWAYQHLSRGTADTLHDVSGWVMLVVSFLALMAVVGLLRWVMVPVTPFRLARG